MARKTVGNGRETRRPSSVPSISSIEEIERTIPKLEKDIRNLESAIKELSHQWNAESLKNKTISEILRYLLSNSLHSMVTAVQTLNLYSLFHADRVDEFGLDLDFEERVRPFFEWMYEKYWRIEVRGMENIPSEGPVLLISNHSGTVPYDAAMIKLAVKKEHPKHREIRFLVEDFVFHFPFLGTFMYRIGGVRACQQNATRLLQHGEAVVAFPEGIKGIGKLYKDRYKLQRFGRGGFIRLCMKTNAPLVPVAVVGAEEIHPMIYKLGWFARAIGVPYIPVTPTFPFLGPLGLVPLPTKWRIEFGKPISFAEYTKRQMDDAILVNRLAEEVRQEIQAMIAQILKKRVSYWS